MKRKVSGELDLGAWQKKFSGFATPAPPRKPRAKTVLQPDAAEKSKSPEKIADIDSLRLEWHQFLEHMSKKSRNFLATHLQSCELASCSPDGILELVCCRKFSCEELLQDKKLLGKELSDFYEMPLELHISYDAEKDACTKEKNVFTLFQELSQQNEVVRFIISEFGGELVY